MMSLKEIDSLIEQAKYEKKDMIEAFDKRITALQRVKDNLIVANSQAEIINKKVVNEYKIKMIG